MKKMILIAAIGFSFPFSCAAFEILALGTSNTNCKNAGQAFTATLGELISAGNINARVINAGVDGDKPVFMMERLKSSLKSFPNTKLVIFEPGPNERNKTFNIEPSSEILEYLRTLQIPTIYVSMTSIQTDDEANAFATKHGAYYYGNWAKGIPTNRTYRQYDVGTLPGHMTAAGCQLWANQMFPLIQQVIKEQGIQ